MSCLIPSNYGTHFLGRLSSLAWYFAAADWVYEDKSVGCVNSVTMGVLGDGLMKGDAQSQSTVYSRRGSTLTS